MSPRLYIITMFFSYTWGATDKIYWLILAHISMQLAVYITMWPEHLNRTLPFYKELGEKIKRGILPTSLPTLRVPTFSFSMTSIRDAHCKNILQGCSGLFRESKSFNWSARSLLMQIKNLMQNYLSLYITHRGSRLAPGGLTVSHFN